MTAEQPEGESVQLRLLWRGLDEVPLLYANQFVVQHERDELILTIGQFQPPILIGDAEHRFEQAKQLGYVPINIVGRYAFTRQRLAELVGYLNEHLEKFDKREQQ